MSGAILVVVSMMHSRSSQEMFPGGKHFFEPLGTLVFSCSMFVSATKLLQEVGDEVSDMDNVKFVMDATTLLILTFVIVTKSIAAYLCFKFGTGSSALIALAEDHRNDIVANVVALLGFVCAVHISPWVDPVLGLGVTLFILYVWAAKILEQLQLLSGKIAPEDYRNAITVLARNHDHRVLQVDTVRAFTAGTGYVVEVDLVLPEGMPLKEAHDIGESLQIFLEAIPQLNVSRAYVHLDTETDHDPKKHM
jgi:divalent metal cation (Fe/Co/Zn/Cd) transporter